MSKNKTTIQDNYHAINEIIGGIEILIKELNNASFKPDIIMAFTRASQVVAGMLAVNFENVEVIGIPKKTVDVENIIKHKMTVYGCGIEMKSNYFENKKILIMYMAINRGRSLEKVMNYIWMSDIKGEIKVATIYISSASRSVFNEALFAYETNDIIQKFNNFPWAINKYHFDSS